MPYIPGASLGGRRADLGSVALGAVDGAGVAWHLQDLEGWSGSEVDADYLPRGSDHGTWASPAYLRERPITLAGKIEAPTLADLDIAVEQLLAACALTDTTLAVYETTPKQVTVRRSGKPLIRYVTDRVAEYSLLVTAADPRRYSTTLQSQSAALPSVTGGLALPITLPITISATTVSGTITLTNEGTISSLPTLTVAGPTIGGFTVVATLPDGTTTQQTYSDTLNAGDSLVLDATSRQVTLNGAVSRRLYLSGTWPEIPPQSTVTFSWFSPTYDAAALLTGTVRSAWM